MTEQNRKVEQYRRENQTAQPGQVLFTGSSLMEQFPIQKLLSEKGDGTIIYNRGIGGYLSRDLLAVIDVCGTDLKPKKVFINIGTNDLSQPDLPIGQMIGNYERILNAFETLNPPPEIYLMAYYPVNFEAASEEMKEGLKIRTNEKINAANREVEKLAVRRGHRYIDVNLPLKDSQGRLKAEYTTEGLHINEAGYRAIYDGLMAYVKE